MLRLSILLFCLVKCWATQNNVVFILADDLGWNDVSFHGSNQIPTPNIDIMAHDGIVLNNYYVTPLCSPSRGAMMTGKYPDRLGLQHSVIRSVEPNGLPLKEKTLPQYFKELGYVTHGVGKWHLGFFKREYIPTHRGFDSFFGFWTGGKDYFTHVSEEEDPNFSAGYDLHDNETVAGLHYIGQYSTEMFTEKAQHIIRTHNYKQPLFLYLAHQAVHTGNIVAGYQLFQAPDKYTNPFSCIIDDDRRKYAGMVSALDYSVGEVLVALDEAKVLDNTIIVFTTDNGGAVKGARNGTGSNFPLRGSKYTLWEGGTRGVAWIWSPELRKRSEVQNGLMHATDWIPTLYAAVGGHFADMRDLDGHNQWPAISRKQSPPRQEFLYNIDQTKNNAAIRKNQYKLVTGSCQGGKFDSWFDRNGKNISHSEIRRYFTQNHDDTKKNTKLLLHMMKSKAWGVLQKNYGVDNFLKSFHQNHKKLAVDCQLEKQNIVEPCKPAEKPCLFDIEKDPCEFNNLASRLPEVVEELKSLLYSYQMKSIPPGNKQSDPLANPKYHGNCFVPWRSMPWLSDGLQAMMSKPFTPSTKTAV